MALRLPFFRDKFDPALRSFVLGIQLKLPARDRKRKEYEKLF